jgi:hypothetical protein
MQNITARIAYAEHQVGVYGLQNWDRFFQS